MVSLVVVPVVVVVGGLVGGARVGGEGRYVKMIMFAPLVSA